jgi:hypothetical protein
MKLVVEDINVILTGMCPVSISSEQYPVLFTWSCIRSCVILVSLPSDKLKVQM